MSVDQELVDAAVALVEARFPCEDWAGGAAMRLEDDTIVTSTAPKAVNPSVEVCHETGALCEAYKLDRAVVASVCVILRPGCCVLDPHSLRCMPGAAIQLRPRGCGRRA